MDDDLGTEIAYQIFAGSRADWDRPSKNLVEFDAYPPKAGGEEGTS
jgi:hypothetical protein